MEDCDYTDERQTLYRELKLKAVKLLSCTQFCALCFESDDLDLDVIDEFTQLSWKSSCTVTVAMSSILERFFGGKASALASNFICKKCKESAMAAYSFIINCEEKHAIILNFMHQLDQQIEDTKIRMKTFNDDSFSNTVYVFTEPHEYKINKSVAKKQNTSVDEDLTEEDELKNKKKRKITCPECKEEGCVHKIYLDVITTDRSIKSKIFCVDCDFACWRIDSLISHVNKMHLEIKPYICEVCAKDLYSRLAYKRHIRMYHTVHLTCQFCKQRFSDRITLDKHTRTCKNKTDKQINLQKKFKCDICEKSFSDLSALSRHKVVHSSTVDRENTRLKCCICKKTFESMKEHSQHMRKHVKEGNACLSCNLLFKSPEEYQNHLNTSSHSNKIGLKKLSCPHCDYKAKLKFVLEAHINRYHLKQAPYKCTECTKSFTTQFNLKCHLKVHNRDDKKTYMCNICDKLFRGPSALKKHGRLHTGERPYSCEICGDLFISSSVLRVHQRTKHSEKNIQCPLCPMTFHVLAYLRAHVKKSHWMYPGEKFDARKIEGLTEEQYDLFRDRRNLLF